MKDYDNRAEVGWKTFYGADPAFEHGESPAAKVISFFCKRRANEPEVDITKQTVKSVDFDIVCDVEWVDHHLEHKLKYNRKWTDYNIYLLGNLYLYLQQALDGGYGKMILSKQEYMSIKPKKK